MIQILLVLLFLLTPAVVDAVDYYVAKTGGGSTCSLASPCLTINAGIARLSAGDRLFVAAGTYDERLNQPPSGGGEGTRTQIIGTAGTVLVMPSINTAAGIMNLTSRSYITFDGIDFDATNAVSPDDSNTVQGINLASTTANITFTNFELRNTGAALGSTGNPGNGFAVGGNNHIFSNCNVHDNGKATDAVWTAGAYAFYIGSGSGVTIDNCQIYRNGGYGVHVYGSPNNVTIKNNTFYENSQVSVISTAELIVSSGTHRVFNNVFRDGVRNGIQVSNSCVNCVIYNNTIARMQGYGIFMSASVSGTIVRNNIFYNNNVGGTGAINLEDTGSGTSKSENLCYGTGGTTGCNLTSDPTFVSTNDFHLLAGSPAINAGTPNITIGLTIPACTSSLLTGCYNGSAPDLGAYESGVAPAGGPPVLAMNRSTVAAGEIISLDVNDDDVNERTEDPGDWIGMYVPGSNSEIDWNYINGTKSAPATAISDAVLTFTAPATPGSYEFRFYEANSFNRLALLPFTVTAQGIVLKLSGTTLKTGPGVTFKIGVP